MAPRGRSRKVGLSRMDAAIDGVAPMGFAPNKIRKKVKDLLDVYGGDEGWPFIEEGSYKLLIESLLEHEEREHPLLLIGPSPSEVLPDEPGRQGVAVAEALDIGTSDAAEEVLCSPKTVPELPHPFLEARPVPSQNVASDKDPGLKSICDIPIVQPGIAPCLDSPPPGFEHTALPEVVVIQRRKPCLGWMGPKDEDDFVLLEPAPVRGQQDRRRRKHISRWDLKR